MNARRSEELIARVALRRRLLEALYDHVHSGGRSPIKIDGWIRQTDLSLRDVQLARCYLIEKGWARADGSLGVHITADGIEVHEAVLKSGEFPPSLSPLVSVRDSESVQIVLGSGNETSQVASHEKRSFAEPRQVFAGAPEHSRFRMSPFWVDVRGEFAYAPFPLLIVGLRPHHVAQAKAEMKMLELRDVFIAQTHEHGTSTYNFTGNLLPPADEDLPSLRIDAPGDIASPGAG